MHKEQTIAFFDQFIAMIHEQDTDPIEAGLELFMNPVLLEQYHDFINVYTQASADEKITYFDSNDEAFWYYPDSIDPLNTMLNTLNQPKLDDMYDYFPRDTYAAGHIAQLMLYLELSALATDWQANSPEELQRLQDVSQSFESQNDTQSMQQAAELLLLLEYEQVLTLLEK